MRHEVTQRRHPGVGDIGVAAAIQQAVEVRPGGAPGGIAAQHEVAHRSQRRRQHVRVGGRIPTGVETLIGPQPGVGAGSQEVAQHGLHRDVQLG